MSEPKLLTFADAHARIEAVVAERPDYVNAKPIIDEETEEFEGEYENCVYLNPDGSPSCIVGTALFDLLVEAGLTPDSPANEGGVYTIKANGLVALTPKADRYLSEAQAAQDNGATWGEAARLAELRVEGLEESQQYANAI